MGLCTSWIEQMLPLSTLRNEVHMMVTDPDHWIDQLVVAGATMLTPHVESLGAHAFRTLRIIHENGCGAGVAINPLTPFADVENLLERIDLITVMTVEIGYSGKPLIPEILKKIERLARFRDEQGLNYEIQIDGSCNEKNFKAMREAGANAFVLGNTGIFKRSPISARPGASPWTPTNTPPARPRPTLADFSSQSPSKPSAQLENTPSTPSPGLPSPRRAVSEADPEEQSTHRHLRLPQSHTQESIIMTITTTAATEAATQFPSSFRDCERIIVQELADVLDHMDETQIDALVNLIANARKVFFVGVGRVELALEAIAKRLAHLGVDTVMVGQITEPAICGQDLLIVGSGSGKTGFPLFIAGKAKSFGAKVARIGIVEDCPMKQYTDLFVHVPAAGKPGSGTKPTSSR